jgi:AcrR family transcriptional regulator
VDAAFRVLRRRDFEGASVQDIVREAGMSSRSFYEFFPSKEDLVLEVVLIASAAFMQRIRAAFDSDLAPDEVVDRLLAAYLEELVPVVIIERERLVDDAAHRIEALRARFLDELIDLAMNRLERAARDGLIQRVPERVFLEVILNGIEGLTRRYAREGKLGEFAAARAVLERALLELVS